MSQFVVVFGTFLLSIVFFETLGMTPEQKAMIHQHFEELGMECLEDHVITDNDINDLRAKKLPTGDNVPCFLACIMKKVGIMDNTGMLQKETALELAKKIFSDDEELSIIHDYLHSCSHVNSDLVQDDDKGCKRAMKAYKCMLENASQFGIDL